jgi:hypothetical protein
MYGLPFAEGGHFFRGNLHCHSSESDGRLPVADVIRRYRDLGYDFVSLTDHFEGFEHWAGGWAGKRLTGIVDTDAFQDPSFVTLPGAELHGPGIGNPAVGTSAADAAGEPWHILAVGLPAHFRCRRGETGPALAARAAAAGAFLALAHPSWYGLTVEEALGIPETDAVEIFNYGTDVHNDRGDGTQLLDALLARGRRLLAIATDDAHGETDDFGGGWINLLAPQLTRQEILRSLKRGWFYSSTGPTLHDVRLEADAIVINTSPVKAVFVTGRGASCERQLGDAVEQARLPIAKFTGDFCRVTVVGTDGTRAWTNPIWLSEPARAPG